MATRKNTAAMHTTAQPQHHDSDIFHILLGDGARHDHVIEDTEYEFFNVLKTAEHGALLNTIVHFSNFFKDVQRGDTVFNKFYVVAAFRLHLVATIQQFLHQADALRNMPWNWQSPLYVQEFFDMLKDEHNITTLRRGAALAQSRSGFTKN